MSGTGKSLRVLVGPLDWGLGHATRCVPLIGELVHRGCDVVLAADGAPAQLLAREFPELQIMKLPGYSIKYGKRYLILSILLQLPRIFSAIRKEKRWLSNLMQQENFDIIISDNRPGFYNSNAHCIYITHQLSIQSGISKWINNRLQYLHHRYTRKFHEVWVPDLEGVPNASGELSHPHHLLSHPVYLGLLSRFKYKPVQHYTYDIMILLSGPEPHRSLLEQQLKQELLQSQRKIILVRGLPGNSASLQLSSNVEVHNHLTASQLEQKLHLSECVISRSGYTTIMDLLKLKKKALFIPTPGQTEQDYLAQHMRKQELFPFLYQHDFTLDKAEKIMRTFNYHQPFQDEHFEHYRDVVESLLAAVKRK